MNKCIETVQGALSKSTVTYPNTACKIKNIDVIIMDPPRTGATKQVINQIIEKKSRSIVYISCDPASLARDTKVLLKNYYSLEKIVGIDLFPMTQHIECIASFTIKKEE